MNKSKDTPREPSKCLRCGSTQLSSGQLFGAEGQKLQFETDTVRYVSDSGPVKAIVCLDCRHLELFVG